LQCVAVPEYVLLYICVCSVFCVCSMCVALCCSVLQKVARVAGSGT